MKIIDYYIKLITPKSGYSSTRHNTIWSLPMAFIIALYGIHKHVDPFGLAGVCVAITGVASALGGYNKKLEINKEVINEDNQQ